MDIVGNGSWYAITLPSRNRERILADCVERGSLAAHVSPSSIDVYIPRVRVKRGDLVLEEDLFPGYGFVFLPAGHPGRRFFHAFEAPQMMVFVLKVLRSRDGREFFTPAPVSNEEMTEIRRRLSGVEIRTRSVQFRVGDLVHIKTGSFVGIEGVIIRLDLAKKEATIEIPFMGTLVPIQVDITDIEKIGSVHEQAVE